ncbi:methionine ABC transporter ATP-binding protein [Microbacterium halophytorum]|uniref:methionine ABC transporter ATP-binding protein n=1 Tax=Microbacterium halophytorum TaxID=2067568 RepID=UPI000CFC9BF9|nr:methionine ABC transporter ATP-binding protein [Microbacterium halophytorum]
MIELRGVGKVHPGGVTALDGVDLTVADGEIHGIVGRSGAGKSTLIRCLTGLDPATSGTVRIDGVDISSASGAALAKARRSIGMVFQHVNLLDSRTAEQNIAHPLEIAGVPAAERRRRVDELLGIVGLTDRRGNYPSQLSGGQKQRVGIARALAAEPRVLLCDEPTSALDSATTRQILDLVRTLRDRLGITVVIITHEMSVVREICDSVSLLDSGRVARSGTLLDVVRDESTPLAKELIALPPVALDDEATVVEAFLTGTGPDAGAVFALLGREGIAAEIAAGTIETLHGAQVGRLRFSTPAAEADRLLAVLRGAGVRAELTTAGAARRGDLADEGSDA